jgi:shikimate kinase
MLGSGKTTLGKQLAAHMNIPFVDMDWEISKRENKSITEIFSRQGEDYFRMVEAEVLRNLSTSPQSLVVGTGGGAPCFHNGMEVINSAGLSIFLDVSVEELMARLANATDRPLLNSTGNNDKEKTLHELRALRLPVYRRAHISIEEPTFEKLLEVVLKGKSNS